MDKPAPDHRTDNQLSPLKLRQIAAYGAGDFGFAVIYHMVSLFLLYFYTDIYGISAAAAGTIFMLARFWDAVNDPILGYISDRTETRWGKYRPYLLFAVLPLAFFNILLFFSFSQVDFILSFIRI